MARAAQIFFNGTVQNDFIVRQSTFDANSATGNGGAIHWASASTIPLTIQNSTLINNKVTTLVTGTGGGINRTAGAVNIESSIVASNLTNGGSGADIFGAASMTVNTSAVSSAAGFTPLGNSGNQIGTAVVMGALANNSSTITAGNPATGVSTITTSKPGPGSPVREAGSNPANLTLDQAGQSRTDGVIDMGALETSDPTPTAKFISAANITSNSQADTTVTVRYNTSFGGGLDTTTSATTIFSHRAGLR